MKVFTKKSHLKEFISKAKEENSSIGFVPTMGALHQGHLSLIKKAQNKNHIVVVSIFVNPTQFDNKADFVKYPKTLEDDKDLLENTGCDVIFIPSVVEIYPENITSNNFDFDGLENQMEGKFRKGHFDGVGTVVKNLLEIVEPDRAYFGEKDFQQLQIIKKLVKKHQLNVKIIGCKIFREKKGLAMSSRNTRLSYKHKKAAPFIYKTLKKVKKKFTEEDINEINNWVIKKFKKHPLLELEYFTIADEATLKETKKIDSNKKYRAFIAVFAGEIRLIDNLRLKLKKNG